MSGSSHSIPSGKKYGNIQNCTDIVDHFFSIATDTSAGPSEMGGQLPTNFFEEYSTLETICSSFFGEPCRILTM